MAESKASAAGVTYEKGRLYQLPIVDIKPNPNQPRKYFGEEELAELTQSIKDKGVLQPILVRQEGPLIILVAGERRLKAAQNAGLTEIPALFIDDNPEEVALIENSLRQNLTAIEEAEAVGRLATELNYTQVQLSKILGKKAQTISDILSLNRLPVEIRDECRINPACPRRVLVEIARKKQERAMITLYNKYKDKGLTSDEVRQEAKRERQEKTTDDQAAAMIVTLAAIITHLENIDWFAISEENRKQLQQTLAALADTFAAIEKTRGVA